MSLRDAVEAAGAMSAAQIRSWLDETDELGRDSTAYTWAGLGQKMLAIGVSPSLVLNAPTIISALPNGGSMLNACLSSGGMDFSDATNRALLQASEIADSPEAVTIVEAMLAIGVQTGQRFRLFGLSALPAESEVQAELDLRARDVWVSQVRDLINAAVGTSTTIQSLKATIAGM